MWWINLVPLVTLISCVSSRTAQLRVIGGKDADIQEYPFMLQIMHPNWGFLCSAVLISQEWALTDARCGNSIYNDTTVYLLADSAEREQGVNVNIANVTVHPDFDLLSWDNDIALIALSGPLACKVCDILEINTTMPNPGAMLTVAGWGIIDQAGNLATHLQATKVPLIDQTVCVETIVTDHNVTGNKFCVGYEDGSMNGPCTLDEGGPMIYDFRLVGIVSYAWLCIAQRDPAYGIAMRIGNYAEWIHEVTGIDL